MYKHWTKEYFISNYNKIHINTTKNKQNRQTKKINIIEDEELKEYIDGHFDLIEKNKQSIDIDITNIRKDNIYDNAILVYMYIVNYLLENYGNKNLLKIISIFIKYYLDGGMGELNSIKNCGELIDNIDKFNYLKINKYIKTDIRKFYSLQELKTYLNQPELNKIILEHKQKKIDNDNIRNGGKLVLSIKNNNESIEVYKIMTYRAAKYYGNGTKWCTVKCQI
jgi:hypothetical protein